MARYSVVLRCTACGNKWKVISKTREPKRTKCPNLDCGKAQRSRVPEFDPGGTAPAIGGSIAVRAVDYTAQMVMHDYGMTDLKDNIREGETMAPRLPPQQQAMADNMFNTTNNPMVQTRRQKQLATLGRRAIAGAYRNSSLDVKGVLPDARFKLQKVGEEMIRRPGIR